jgi:hypothetical protein
MGETGTALADDESLCFLTRQDWQFRTGAGREVLSASSMSSFFQLWG